MNRAEYLTQQKELDDEIASIQQKKKELTERYLRDVLFFNNLKKGDVIRKSGLTGVVMGVSMVCNIPRLLVNKVRKDGTPTKEREFLLCSFLHEI